MTEGGRSDWSGTRAPISGTPVVVGAAIVGLVLIVILATVRRDPGLVASLSQEYTRVMAGTLVPTVRPPAGALGDQLRNAGVGFDVHVRDLGPEFVLLGGTTTDVEGRRVAAWMYRAHGSETVLVEAFRGGVDELGTPDEVRADPPPRLALFRKTTQTIVAWQEGPLVYVLISTLPTEQVVALARRAAGTPQPGSHASEAP